MIYLKNITRRAQSLDREGYPFSLNVIRFLEYLEFKSPVTFLTGDNGSGKSTILEAIAAGVEAYALGFSGRIIDDPCLSHATKLANCFFFSRLKYPPVKMFFRAEDSLGYVRALNEERLDDYIYNYKKHTGIEPTNIEYMKNKFIQNNEIDTRSHGEGFLDLMSKRLHGDGLYLLDEPETPLSVTNQIQFLKLLQQLADDGAQFIIVTHSPVLLALPGATIYEIAHDGEIVEKGYDELVSVRLLKRFLAFPDRYLNA